VFEDLLQMRSTAAMAEVGKNKINIIDWIPKDEQTEKEEKARRKKAS